MLALKLSLEQLQEKLQLLIKQYGVLDKENQHLKASLTKQENKNKELFFTHFKCFSKLTR